MELKPGYKQTEVGVIPEDWEDIPIGSLGTFSKGQGIRKDEAVSGDLPCVRYGEIYTHHNDIIRFFSSRISAEVAKSSKKIKKGDLLFAGSGETKEEIGKCVAFIGDDDAYAGGDIVILSPKKGDSIFFGYLFNAPVVARQKASKGQGDAVVHISGTALASIKIPLPPTKAEQEAIAEALSDADALIESLEQLISKKRQIKQGAMQELLTGKKRLPGFREEWEVRSFGAVFDYRSTATNSRSDLTEDGDTYYVHYGDIHTRFHNHLDFRFDKPPRIMRSKCGNATLLRNGDWVMADASEDFDGVGKSIEIIGLEEGSTVVSGLHTCLLREKDPTFAPGFKGHLGNLKSLHDQFLRVATGMKVFGVSKTALRDLLLPIPPFPEQTAIATILSDMDAEITALKTKLAKARQVKQGMMQELLTGRIRLI